MDWLQSWKDHFNVIRNRKNCKNRKYAELTFPYGYRININQQEKKTESAVTFKSRKQT